MNRHLILVTVVSILLFTRTYSQEKLISIVSTKNHQIDFTTNKTLSHSIVKNKKKLPPFNMIMSPPTDDKVYIDFVGSGDIQKSISEGKDINANTGLGIIFERFNGYKKIIQSFELEAVINIATTADSINSTITNNIIQNQRDFGTYILNPISAKQALFINSNIYFGYPSGSSVTNGFNKVAQVISGINLRFISSNSVWKYSDSSKNLGALAFRIGLFHEFIPDNYRLSGKGTPDEGRSKYSLFFGVYRTYRGIFGDIKSKNNSFFRNKILGSEQTSFKGTEMNFGFRLNNLRAEFQMPLLKEKDKSIEGLTNTQFLFSVRFIGGFSLKLNKSNTAGPTNTTNSDNEN